MTDRAAAGRRRASPCARPLLALLLVLALDPAPAHAHGSLAIGDFYSGMFHPLLHLETLLPALALALWSGQLGQRDAWQLPLLFVGSMLLGAVAGLLDVDLGLGRTWLQLSIAVLGLLAATRGRLPAAAALTLVFLFGLLHGHSNTYEAGAQLERPWLFLAGLLTGIGLLLFHVVTRIARYRAFWVQTAARVLGSWIAAAGVLVLVLGWAGKA